MVAVRASKVEPPILAVSKAASIEDSSLQVDLGTQRVFPLFAMICSNTLVMIDCKFLLLSLAYVRTCVTIWCFITALILIFLYWVFRLGGMTMQQMFISSFMDLSISA